MPHVISKLTTKRYPRIRSNRDAPARPYGPDPRPDDHRDTQ
jgi:hypothetical protein